MGSRPLTDAELAEARALCAAVDFEPEPTRPVDAPFAPHHEDAACWYYVTDTTGLKLIACRDEEVAQFVAGARSLLPAALDEIDRLRVEVLERRDNVDRLNLANMRLHEDVARLRDALEIVDQPEPPAEVFAAPDGPPVPCEVCCAPIAPRSAVASWVDEGRHVVAHARRCPEPEMWFIEYVPRSSRRRDWMRVCDGSTGDDLVRPYEEALYRARDLGARTRVRLVRAKAVRP